MKKEIYKISKNYVIVQDKKYTWFTEEFIVYKRIEKEHELARWEIVDTFKNYEEARDYIKGLM